MSTVAVTGAGGKTGRAVTAALAARGAEVREIRSADWPNLADALQDCDAIYLIAPNMHADEPEFVSEAIDAARAAEVASIAYHSVAAPYAPAMLHHWGKAVGEDLVRRSGLRWTILQPCAYVQNFVPALAAAEPVLKVAYNPDRVFGFVDLADVAEAAATVLLDPAHYGCTYELGGPRLVSLRDVAAVASEVVGLTVPLEQVTSEEWAASDGAGIEDRVREWLVAMFDYYDAHGLPTGSLPLAALLGRTPTSVKAALARELHA